MMMIGGAVVAMANYGDPHQPSFGSVDNSASQASSYEWWSYASGDEQWSCASVDRPFTLPAVGSIGGPRIGWIEAHRLY